MSSQQYLRCTDDCIEAPLQPMTVQQRNTRVSCCSPHLVHPHDQLPSCSPCPRSDILATGRGAFAGVHGCPPNAPVQSQLHLKTTASSMSARARWLNVGCLLHRSVPRHARRQGSGAWQCAKLCTIVSDSAVRLTPAATGRDGPLDAQRLDRNDDCT